MLYNNAQYKNETMDQGSVIEYYKKLKDIISTNDGTRSFIIRTEDCHDQNAPFNQSQETRLRITHSDHMISQITEGFINFKIASIDIKYILFQCKNRFITHDV